MDVDAVLLSGLETFGSVLAQVKPDDWERLSPCAGWDARAVSGHVLTVLDSAATTLRGESFDWSKSPDPRTVPGDDPLQVFEARSRSAREALEQADLDAVVDTPIGAMAIAQRLAFPAMDLHLHAWDLGRAIGVEVEIPDAVAAFVHSALDPLPESMMRSEGVFGPEVAAPADATTTEALMAWLGRESRG